MPPNYTEVLQDLEAREARLLNELTKIRAAKPAILALKEMQDAEQKLLSPKGQYAGLGNTAAIRKLFEGTNELLTREEIYNRLTTGGWKSDAGDPKSSLSATLSQMKDELDKIEDRFRRKPLFEAVTGRQQELSANAPEPPSWRSPSAVQG